MFISVLGNLIQIYIYIILAYVLIGYFPEARRSKIYEVLAGICDPLLNLFRFASFSGISFAPILAVVFLNIIYRIIIILYY